MSDGLEGVHPSDRAGIELLLIDPDRHWGSLVRLVEMGQASTRKPPSLTDVATCDLGPGYRLRFHLNGASRAFRLCADRHTSTTAHCLREG